jgi:hypothetical protein
MLALVLLGVDLDSDPVGMGVLGIGAVAVAVDQVVTGIPDIETDVLGVLVGRMTAAVATMVSGTQQPVQPAEDRLRVVYS